MNCPECGMSMEADFNQEINPDGSCNLYLTGYYCLHCGHEEKGNE